MGLKNTGFAVLFSLLVFGSLIHGSTGAVYTVGDSAGWTTIGSVDYKNWAATKSFQLGDVILFHYNAQFHNVMQVRHPHYQVCNASSPIATHTTGNDSITITNHGHHFFICGVPGHCQSGQKVDINVLKPSSAPAPSETPSPPAAVAAPAPSPDSNHAAALLHSSIRFLGAPFAVLMALGFLI